MSSSVSIGIFSFSSGKINAIVVDDPNFQDLIFHVEPQLSVPYKITHTILYVNNNKHNKCK
jgi:hypothetical protein